MKRRVSLSESAPLKPSVQNNPTHVGVLVNGVATKFQAQTPNILRDTNGSPLWDMGYSIITAYPLSNGLKVTVKNTE
jgi:hypothetical protein